MPSDSLTRKYKKVADTAALPMKADREFYTALGLQNKCMFEIMLIPEIDPKSNWIDTGRQLLSVPRDFFIGRYYLYSIQDLPLTGFDYIRYGGLQGVKDMIYPESFTATFLEDNIGSVKGFFRNWIDKIAVYDSFRKDYVFNDNQSISKKYAIVMPIQQDSLPSTEWIKIDGIKIKSITGIGYDHSVGDTELITVEFACDTIRLIGLSLGDLL